MDTWAPGMSLDFVEKQAILEAFRFYRSNKTQTSIALGISIRTLETKLDRYKKDKNDDDEQYQQRAAHRAEFIRRSRAPANGIAPVVGPGPFVESPTQGAQPQVAVGDEADRGVRVEPLAGLTPEHAVSMSKPAQVQKVLPAHAQASSQRRTR